MKTPLVIRRTSKSQYFKPFVVPNSLDDWPELGVVISTQYQILMCSAICDYLGDAVNCGDTALPHSKD